MSNNICTFSFATQSVRVLMIDDAPWFVAADVCAALGLLNVTRAIERLDEDEKSQVVDSDTLINNQGSKINKLLNIINESGLYTLILTSRKAKPARGPRV
jgi:prophage antirepressor-like protein